MVRYVCSSGCSEILDVLLRVSRLLRQAVGLSEVKEDKEMHICASGLCEEKIEIDSSSRGRLFRIAAWTAYKSNLVLNGCPGCFQFLKGINGYSNCLKDRRLTVAGHISVIEIFVTAGGQAFHASV